MAVLDTDSQGGLAGWWNARIAKTPHWIDPTHGLSAAISATRAVGYGLLPINTPPSLSATIADVVAVSDLVVIPVRPSPNNLRAVCVTVGFARKARGLVLPSPRRWGVSLARWLAYLHTLLTEDERYAEGHSRAAE